MEGVRAQLTFPTLQPKCTTASQKYVAISGKRAQPSLNRTKMTKQNGRPSILITRNPIILHFILPPYRTCYFNFSAKSPLSILIEMQFNTVKMN